MDILWAACQNLRQAHDCYKTYADEKHSSTHFEETKEVFFGVQEKLHKIEKKSSTKTYCLGFVFLLVFLRR